MAEPDFFGRIYRDYIHPADVAASNALRGVIGPHASNALARLGQLGEPADLATPTRNALSAFGSGDVAAGSVQGANALMAVLGAGIPAIKVGGKLAKLSDAQLAKFVTKTKRKYGIDLRMNISGDDAVKLDHIAVPRELRKRGIGSAAMEDINEFADRRGRRVLLNVAQRDDRFGTTSRGRLVKFYKRHGFVENKGRNRRD